MPKEYRGTVQGIKVWQKYELEQLCADSVKAEDPGDFVRDLIRQVGQSCTPRLQTVEPMQIEPNDQAKRHVSARKRKEAKKPQKRKEAKKPQKRKDAKKPQKRKPRTKFENLTEPQTGRKYRVRKCGLHVLERPKSRGSQTWYSFSHHAGPGYSKCPGPERLQAVSF